MQDDRILELGNFGIAGILQRTSQVMKLLFLLSILLLGCLLVKAQRPKNGTYTYTIAFQEWGGKSLGATCSVQIKGDSIKIIHNGSGNLTGKKGDIIEHGIIIRHLRTGKWIIGKNWKDKYAKEIGGCSDGPLLS
jgi:hypothetical protein